MKIVKIWGGVGNQLFGYALYKALQEEGFEVFADLTWFRNKNRKFWYPYQLDILGVKVNNDIKGNAHHSETDYELLRLSSKNKFAKIPFGLLYQLKRIKKKKLICFREQNNYAYYNNIFSDCDMYLLGYWQNLDYFKNIIKQIATSISFSAICENKLEKQLLRSESVSVHIRRCDYEFEDFDEICSKEYYENAISYMDSVLKNPQFYIFSNRPDKAKQMLGESDNYIFVETNDRMHGLGDMKLMSQCKNNIISNSTFSWWGAVLNQNKDAIVIAPKKWKFKYDSLNLCFDNWIEK